ncbi:hypothetical protein SAMN06265360_10646 [Haloechinothrix alba]|uniref:Uncharacterized protein n=1 Tax=Haloechinothrix alba TaxID=664784 RepID=A0A238WCW3_9PSEU|nr:hypothetical protein [Haloechinothrix alba]SNR44390.1 hypothetical protein SAMN06265360_10646 [Haloechinothrix alba]
MANDPKKLVAHYRQALSYDSIGHGAALAFTALERVLDLHPRSTLRAAVMPERFGEGRCACCARSELIWEGSGYLNDGSRRYLMHEHHDPDPHCSACPEGYPWPCPTVRAITEALEGEPPHPVELHGRVSQDCAHGCAWGGRCYSSDIVPPYCERGYEETYEGTWD